MTHVCNCLILIAECHSLPESIRDLKGKVRMQGALVEGILGENHMPVLKSMAEGMRKPIKRGEERTENLRRGTFMSLFMFAGHQDVTSANLMREREGKKEVEMCLTAVTSKGAAHAVQSLFEP